MEFAGFRLERISRQPGIKHHGVTFWVIAGSVAGVAAFLVLLGPGAKWLDLGSLNGLTPEQRATDIDAMRGYLIQVGAGFLALGALIYTALNFRLSREGHVTDRYTKAIEQLGSNYEDVRLGAIYALERIMIDSARDQPTIVEVLAAFVRGHAPHRPSGDDEDPDSEYPEFSPSSDIIAAVTVLGRRPQGREERGKVDLKFTYLAYARLEHLNLSGMDLSNSVLYGTILTRADLGRAILTNANLSAARLVDANLTYANLIGASMSETVLEGANLTGADLTSAFAMYAHISKANLTGADLKNANLCGADLSDSALDSANLVNSRLVNVNLTGATLVQADLTCADLIGTELSDKQRSAAIGVFGPGRELESPDSRPVRLALRAWEFATTLGQ
jgi:uncharacterized protein YjbI with pentapeptide repeats